MKLARSIFVVVCSVAIVACWAKDPCGEGYTERADYNCAPIPVALTSDGGAEASAPSGEASEAGADGEADGAAAEASAAPATTFGKACTSMSDCGGDAPICAYPQLPYCTQIACNPGEANAGACPPGWTCFQSPQASACVRN